MANDATYELGNQQVGRIFAGAKQHRLHPRKATERWLCEEISRGFSKHILVPHLVKGGCIHPQTLRQTGNLDVLFGRKMTVSEIHAAFEKMKLDLESAGIVLNSYSRKPDSGLIGGDPADRYAVQATAGKTKISTHVVAMGGTDLFPRYTWPRRDGPTYFEGQEPLNGYFQTLESQAADKIISLVVCPTITRWQDYRDLAMLWDMQLDLGIIGAEVVHKLRRKVGTNEAIMAKLPELPEALRYDFAGQQGLRWQAWANTNKVAGDWEDTLCRARHLYAYTRERMAKSLERHNRIEGVARQQPDFKSRIADRAKERRAERAENVVELAEWRSRPRGL
jgi:hypothetical protein